MLSVTYRQWRQHGSKFLGRMASAVNCVDICLLAMEGSTKHNYTEKVKNSEGDTILKKVRAKEEEKEMMVIEEKYMEVTKEAKIKVLGKQKEGMSKDYEKYRRKISKVAHEEELEEWEKNKTLRRYNVSMEGMQAFQRFQFYYYSGYLPWPTPNTKNVYEWEYGGGKRPHCIL
eukprot:Gb_18093 [translate_table: standard]